MTGIAERLASLGLSEYAQCFAISTEIHIANREKNREFCNSEAIPIFRRPASPMISKLSSQIP
jgi:hypothetical protein